MTLLDKVKAHTVEVGDCWEWLGRYNGRSPRMSYKDQSRPVRRVLRIEAGEVLGKNDYITQCCGNWRCVNPEHSKRTRKATFLVEIGKSKSAAKLISAAKAREKLKKRTPEMEADALSSSDTCKVTAERWGVSIDTIHQIRRTGGTHVNPWMGLMR